MALFNKEPEKNIRTDASVRPQTGQAVPVPPPAPPLENRSVPPPRQTASAPMEARAYLDQGSKVSGKLSFDGPARIDGQVDGEITAKDTVMIGESAVVTAQIKAASIVVAAISRPVSGSRFVPRPKWWAISPRRCWWYTRAPSSKDIARCSLKARARSASSPPCIRRKSAWWRRPEVKSRPDHQSPAEARSIWHGAGQPVRSASDTSLRRPDDPPRADAAHAGNNRNPSRTGDAEKCTFRPTGESFSP